MRGTSKFMAVALPLLLAACGQEAKPAASEPETPTPIETTAPGPEQGVEKMAGKTLAQTLQEPGWVETSEGFWERGINGDYESIYTGPEGARAALQQRQRWQAEMLETAPESERSKLQGNFAKQNSALIRAASLASSQNTAMQAQAFDDCTHAESIQRLTSGSGIKATGWIRCNKTGLYPNVGGNVSSNYGVKEVLPQRTPTSATGAVDIGGTSNCNAYIFTEATDFWGYTYGRQRSGYGCNGVTYRN